MTNIIHRIGHFTEDMSQTERNKLHEMEFDNVHRILNNMGLTYNTTTKTVQTTSKSVAPVSSITTVTQFQASLKPEEFLFTSDDVVNGGLMLSNLSSGSYLFLISVIITSPFNANDTMDFFFNGVELNTMSGAVPIGGYKDFYADKFVSTGNLTAVFSGTAGTGSGKIRVFSIPGSSASGTTPSAASIRKQAEQ